MILQPIIERELRVGSRNKQHYIARTVIAASTTMMLGMFLYSMARAGMRGPGGRDVFQGVSMAGAMWTLIAGLGATCDCLSSEKRDGTLGLLFLVMPVLVGTMIGHLASIKLKCAQAASNRWLEDRNSGALEMLLSTPLQIPELIQGQRRGLFQIFAGSVVATFLINALFCGLIIHIGSLGPNPPIPSEKRFIVGLLILLPTLMMVADLTALSMVGIWSGVKARQAGQASAIAISRVLAWPLLVTWVVGFLIPLHLTRRNPGFTFVFVLWLLIGIAGNIMAYRWAEVRLLTRFRVAATQRFQPAEPGFWSRCQNWLAKRIRRE